MSDIVKDYIYPITYISDCQDFNTQGRLKARVASYFPSSNVNFVGVSNDVEAAINLVDIVDAYDGQPGVILANVAPRHGKAKIKWENGTPFGHFKLGVLDIFTTIDGYTLSLLQKVLKHDIVVNVYDIPSVVPHMGLPEDVQERIINTQFRSLDYLPRLAAAIMAGKDLPITETFSAMPKMPHKVCWIDSFGNIKTNILPEEIDFKVGESRVLRVGDNKQFYLPCHNRLKDIPEKQVALTVGSSGYEDKRFVEIMQQGKSAVKRLAVKTGLTLEYIKE
ncbi:hypothetical protein CVV38_02355 [Candidatus Peregrinibacteria bacterium HGW-Peregrinibacteria-1]|jgi:hypothetical protein|nr:MAG: hypothetical protein CVV38_02355 [Candidatus Peregrinibacteria bacterium HGW-Peregrinibacteria-1]